MPPTRNCSVLFPGELPRRTTRTTLLSKVRKVNTRAFEVRLTKNINENKNTNTNENKNKNINKDKDTNQNRNTTTFSVSSSNIATFCSAWMRNQAFA